VTFEGPACQLWLTSTVNGEPVEPTPLGDPTEGRRGRADDRAAYCEDGFHPSADGYRLIAEALLSAVDDAASERATLQ